MCVELWERRYENREGRGWIRKKDGMDGIQ